MRHWISGRCQRCLCTSCSPRRNCAHWHGALRLCSVIETQNPKLLPCPYPSKDTDCFLCWLISYNALKKICLLQIHFSSILKQREPFEELLRQKKNPSFQLPTFSSNCRSGHYLAQTHAGWPSKGTLLAGSFLYFKACAFPLVIAVLWQPITVSVHALTMLFTILFFRPQSFLCQCNQNLCV